MDGLRLMRGKAAACATAVALCWFARAGWAQAPAAEPSLTPPVRPTSLPPSEQPVPHPAPAHVDDPARLRLPPIVVQQDAVRDSRSLVWIGGGVVLLAVFLWNRNRRLELERLEAAQSQAPRRTEHE